MLNRYNFASSSFEFSTFLSSRNAKKIARSLYFHLLHLSGAILRDWLGFCMVNDSQLVKLDWKTIRLPGALKHVMLGSCRSPMTKEYNWQIINMSELCPFVTGWQAVELCSCHKIYRPEGGLVYFPNITKKWQVLWVLVCKIWEISWKIDISVYNRLIKIWIQKSFAHMWDINVIYIFIDICHIYVTYKYDSHHISFFSYLHADSPSKMAFVP